MYLIFFVGKKMKLGKALTWFTIFSLAISMAVFITLGPTSHLMQSGTTVEDTSMASQVLQGYWVRKLLEKILSGPAMEESAREVPTGPDPLHHHTKPTKP